MSTPPMPFPGTDTAPRRAGEADTSGPPGAGAPGARPLTPYEWLRATDYSPANPLVRVRWSLSFAALLVYLFVIVTYQVHIGDVAMGAALIGLLFEPRGIRVPALLVLLTATLIWAVIGQFNSPWPADGGDSIEILWKLALITLVAVSTLNDRRRIRLFILAFILFYALYPARGTLFNYFLGGYTIFGRAVWNYIYRNSNDLAALTLLQLSMAAGILVTERNRLIRKAALVAVVVLSFVILLTQSRGVFLGLGLFGLFALAGERKKARLLGVIAIITIIALWQLPESAWERFGMLGKIGRGGTAALEQVDDRGSAEQRWQIWQTAFRIIGDNPVTGVGIGAYPDANAMYSPRLGRRDTHSTYFNVLAETGIPGLILFLGMIAAAVLPAERVRRRLKRLRPRSAQQLYLLELGLLGYLTAGIFASYARLTFLYLHLVIIWALAMAHRRELASATRASMTPRGVA